MAINKVITFDKSAREFVLNAFGAGIDKDGYVVEKNNPSQRVLSPDGGDIEVARLAGITKGSLLFFRSDLPSLLELADRLK